MEQNRQSLQQNGGMVSAEGVAVKVEEAKTKICPFILNNAENAYQKGQSPYESPANINCIAGDCMAWEWKQEYVGMGNYVPSKEEGHCKRLSND